MFCQLMCNFHMHNHIIIVCDYRSTISNSHFHYLSCGRQTIQSGCRNLKRAIHIITEQSGHVQLHYVYVHTNLHPDLIICRPHDKQ